MKICNSQVQDINTIFELYKNATNLQKEKSMIAWPNFEKKLVEKEIDEKINLGAITQEIEFDENFNLLEIAKTGYCLNGLHSRCFAKEDCDCVCHSKEYDGGR